MYLCVFVRKALLFITTNHAGPVGMTFTFLTTQRPCAQRQIHRLSQRRWRRQRCVYGGRWKAIQQKINSICNDKLWFADIGMSSAFGDNTNRKVEILEIKNNKDVKILRY